LYGKAFQKIALHLPGKSEFRVDLY
jgi:hypothetical protein